MENKMQTCKNIKDEYGKAEEPVYDKTDSFIINLTSAMMRFHQIMRLHLTKPVLLFGN